MNPKKYISQPLAQKIFDKAKEKGVKLPESEYYFLPRTIDGEYYQIPQPVNSRYFHEKFQDLPAFDTYELGEILFKNFRGGFPPYWCDQREMMCWVRDMHRGTVLKADTEVEARGKMLLYLIENDLLK